MEHKNIKNLENKRERFKRLATARTKAVIERIKILGNCANRYAYEYTEDDVRKIFSAIESALAEVKKRFYIPKNNDFKLD
jgi:CHASE1-domain containing sensor protein